MPLIIPDEQLENIVCFAQSVTEGTARLIDTPDVVVEDRVSLLCHFGCDDYAKKLTCPPHTPKPDDFRRSLEEYRKAVIVSFPCPATLDRAGACSLMSLSHKAPPVEVATFWKDWHSWKLGAYNRLLEIEKYSFSQGLPFALAFGFGSCPLCTTCATTFTECRFPSRRRCSLEAVGINVVATSARAGINLSFPFSEHPLAIGLVLLG